MEKLKRVKVSTPKGDRFITMRPVTDDLEEGEIFCDSICPYGGKVCQRFPDPRNPENSELTFCDFCSDLGEDEGKEELNSMVPLEGEIERAFPDFPDIVKVIEEEDPLVRVGDVIDSVCADGCDLYRSDHSECTSEYPLCILKGILKDKNFGKKPRRIKSEEE